MREDRARIPERRSPSAKEEQVYVPQVYTALEKHRSRIDLLVAACCPTDSKVTCTLDDDIEPVCLVHPMIVSIVLNLQKQSSLSAHASEPFGFPSRYDTLPITILRCDKPIRHDVSHITQTPNPSPSIDVFHVSSTLEPIQRCLVSQNQGGCGWGNVPCLWRESMIWYFFEGFVREDSKTIEVLM